MTNENKKNETTLRQAENFVLIEGTLVENRLVEETKNEKEAITGEMDIEVKENEVHTVSFFSYKYKNDGTENGIYKGLKTAMDEYKSVASHGRKEADKIRVTGGNIRLNEYYGQDGQLKSFPQVQANFVGRLKADEKFNPRAEFDVEIVVQKVIEEYKNDEETGRAIVKAYIVLYEGKVIPFEFVVDEDGAEFVMENYEPGVTTRVYGDIINFKEVKRTEKPTAFGKPQEKVTTTTVREFLITGGSEPYDEENANTYDKEVIKKALAEREVWLEQLKNKKKEDKGKKKKEEKKGGFNTKKQEKTISDEDLPF
ncbi:hypothetical protein [Paenibacillus dendritiformis]|uniref:hypothetical protein n=1 Tax=Paenibacillus dendritiformis TaxID=130049 RepID=UPI00387E1BAF